MEKSTREILEEMIANDLCNKGWPEVVNIGPLLMLTEGWGPVRADRNVVDFTADRGIARYYIDKEAPRTSSKVRLKKFYGIKY